MKRISMRAAAALGFWVAAWVVGEVWAGTEVATGAPDPVLKDPVVAEEEAFFAALAQRDSESQFPPRDANDPFGSVLGEQLSALLFAFEQGKPDFAQAARLPTRYLRSGDSVVVELFADRKLPGPLLEDWLAERKIEITWTFNPYWVEAVLPIDRLRDFALAENMVRARLAKPWFTSEVSEGFRASRAERWRMIGGIKGSNIRVAVIDVFNRRLLEGQRIVGEVPPASVTTERFLTNAETDDHGNQVLEILYDFLRGEGTPDDGSGAQFLLLQAATQGEIKRALREAKAWGADIVNLSMVTMTSGYNDGEVASSILQEEIGSDFKRLYEAGILVVASAGNDAQSHWGGKYLPHATNINNMDWNHSYLTGRPLPGMGTASQNVNVLRKGSNECLLDGESIYAEMLIDRRMLREEPRAFKLRLVRQGADGQWHNIYYTNDGAGSDVYAFRRIDTDANSIELTYGTGDQFSDLPQDSGRSPGCATGSARYGLKVLKEYRPAGAPPFRWADNHYMQLFVNGLQLRYAIAQGSISGSATYPWVLSVGAAYCGDASYLVRPAGGNCISYRVANYSGRGPIAGLGGNYPRERVFRRLDPFNPGSYRSDEAIKPELVSFANVSTWAGSSDGSYEAFGGASAAVPHVVAMAAYMEERFPLLRSQPDAGEMKYALARMASFREADLPNMGGIENGAYNDLDAYTYGYGFLRFQKEDHLEYRGCTVSARVGEYLRAQGGGVNPTTRACEGPFRDSYDASVRVRFVETDGTPVLYPLGMPKIGFRNGPAGTLPTDLAGGEVSYHNFPYTDPSHESVIFLPQLWGGHHGYFLFPVLRFTRIPLDPRGNPIAVTNPYDLQMRAQTIRGVDIPIAGAVDRVIRESYPPVSLIVCNVGASDSRCPVAMP